MNKSLHAAFRIVAAALSVSFTAYADSTRLDHLAEYINPALEAWGVPGLAIAVVKDGETILATGFGTRTIGKDEPVDQDTLFAIGSTSKAFTCAALAMLVDEKKLAWDDRAGERLPGFELFDPYVTRELTVRDLLCHRSGLARGDLLWYGTAFSRDEILRRVRYLEPSWSFRSTFGYQNTMYLAAGQIMPAVSGVTWDDFVADRIFKPLGMTNSHTTVRTLEGIANAATPHEKIAGQIVPVNHRNLDNIAPAGSIYSSVGQMTAWLKLHLARGEYNGVRLISEAQIAEMHMPQMTMRYEGRFAEYSPNANSLAYGLGWFVADYGGRRSIHHGGAIDGMRTHVGMLPDDGIGVVAIANRGASLLPVAAAYWIYDALLGNEETDWSAKLRAFYEKTEAEAAAAIKRIEDARDPAAKPALPGYRYLGEYESKMYGRIQFRYGADEATVHVDSEMGLQGKAEHWHRDTYRITWDDPVMDPALAAFELNALLEVTAVEVSGFETFRRVSPQTERP